MLYQLSYGPKPDRIRTGILKSHVVLPAFAAIVSPSEFLRHGDEVLERPYPLYPTELRAVMFGPAGFEPATWGLRVHVVPPAFAAIISAWGRGDEYGRERP